MKETILSLFLVFLLVLGAQAGQGEETKIAIASDGKTGEASVSTKAARCAYYLLFTKGGELIEAVDNPFKDAPRGAGTMAAELLAKKKVSLLVAASVGNKMVAALKNMKITHIEFSGKVEDALKTALEKEAEETALGASR